MLALFLWKNSVTLMIVIVIVMVVVMIGILMTLMVMIVMMEYQLIVMFLQPENYSLPLRPTVIVTQSGTNPFFPESSLFLKGKTRKENCTPIQLILTNTIDTIIEMQTKIAQKPNQSPIPFPPTHLFSQLISPSY